MPVGSAAPDFETRGALAGNVFTLQALRPAQEGPGRAFISSRPPFTPGCTAEAHEFAEATEEFKKAGAQVIGMSADPVDKLAEFSTKECSNKFAVASAGPKVIEGYGTWRSSRSRA